MKINRLAFRLLILVLVFSTTSVNGKVVARRNVEVHYNYKQISDGFGNIRTVIISGYVKNSSNQNVAHVAILFKLDWESRSTTSKKLKFKDILSGDMEEFKFEIDLGTRPDILKNIRVKISRIKFSTKRQASKPSEHDIATRELYSLVRVSEEGKRFHDLVKNLVQSNPFKTPVKDEFETTNEYETRVNYAQNVHFTKLMDKLEQSFGELLGGPGAHVRFLPRTVNKELVYLSENSFYFQVPISLGHYNADLSRFEDVNLIPRTIPFGNRTLTPYAEIEIIHKTGMFFLRKPVISVSRNEAREWRKIQTNLVLELTVHFGVTQDGPYLAEMCLVDTICLKNRETGDIFRKWTWESAN